MELLTQPPSLNYHRAQRIHNINICNDLIRKPSSVVHFEYHLIYCNNPHPFHYQTNVTPPTMLRKHTYRI